jgi:hypothetical protein
MKIKEASSELFWRALKELPRNEREGVIKRMIKDKEFMEDMIHMITKQCGEVAEDGFG